MNQIALDTLLQLTRRRDSHGIKALLQSLPQHDKGTVFEQYTAEIYRGNGWLVQVSGGRSDRGADILLYHPKMPSKVSLIVQAKNQNRPLTFDDTKIELVKFEEQAASKHSCQQFNLIALNGFVDEAQKLAEFNMLLSGWDTIRELIERYDPQHITEPQIDLYAHNKVAYDAVNKLWKQSKYVAVVQATGTGKSYIIAKVLSDFQAERKLVMAPSRYILKQQREKVPWATQSTRFMAYAGAANLSNSKIKELDLKLIVLDEFHRCGAEVWGGGVWRILRAHPEARVLGTSATPIRYLDSSRDMSDELFGGMVAANLPLAEAIMRNILPSPKYVAALYTLEEEIADLQQKLEESNKSDLEKKNIAAEIKKIRLDWERTSGIPQILKKHLKPEINKFIVFCRDQEHLDAMEVEVARWFQKAKTHRWRKIYRVLAAEPDSDKNLEEFRSAKQKDTAHLLFAIDMFNEGLHIPDVRAVILLRPTESPTVFYQQIGRCIEVGAEHTPIIFDFVNNFKNIMANDFVQDLEEAKDRERERRAEVGLEEYAPSIHITDETKDVLKVFEEISEILQPWETMLQQLVEYKEAYGHCDVPITWNDNPRLGRWVHKQRQSYRKGELDKGRIRRLEEIGFTWYVHTDYWENMFSELVKFRSKHGHCNVPRLWSENRRLALWVGVQRRYYGKGDLKEDRIKRLEEIGFTWYVHTDYWEKKFSELVQFRSKHGHCNVPGRRVENPKLATWVSKQRDRKHTLDENRIRRLEEIGFAWEPISEAWEQVFSELVRFKSVQGHCDVPKTWSENPRLAGWVGNQRESYSKGKLPESRIRRLEEVGFIWNSRTKTWDMRFAELMCFRSEHGHCNVPQNWRENPKLSKWVETQRRRFITGDLKEDRIKRLEEIGFTWYVHTDYWEKKFSELVQFRSKHGHCNVPRLWSENPRLATWTQAQRSFYGKGRLKEDRIKCLEEIGFTWYVHTDYWEKKFSELVQFRSKHGHCNVPDKWAENPELGIWVGNQRQRYRKGKLDESRIRRLEKIGFKWRLM